MPRQDLSRAEAKRLRQLQHRSIRESEGVFLAEGIRVVEELLTSRIVLRNAVVSPSLEDSPRGRELAAELEKRTTLYATSDDELRKISDTETPQGVIVSAAIPRATLPSPAPATTLVLDGLQDPGNFGTLLRSAVAFGAGLVVTLPGTVDPWNGKSIRAAAGTSFHVPIVAADLATLREWTQRESVQLWGTAADGVPVRRIGRSERVALVMGNEGAGISNTVRDVLDNVVALEMRGKAESLNAAVAGGILLYLLSEDA